MRKTKPPVGWEHVKNCFPVPNILLDMDLPASAVAVYLLSAAQRGQEDRSVSSERGDHRQETTPFP